MASVLYANVHRNFDDSGNVSVFVFGTAGDQVRITSIGGFSETAEIGVNGSVSIDIPQSLSMAGTGVNNNGLKITSDGDISAYVSNRQTFTTDLTVVFDQSSLGNDYVLASFGNGFQEADGGQFSVQATQDESTFTFTLPDGQTATISLDTGEIFKFSTVDNTGNAAIGVTVPDYFDLTGTLISSNQPVAAFSGHSCTNIGSGFCGHIVEQMPAVAALSHAYVVAEAFSSSGLGNNLVRVIAAEADTEVRADGALVATLLAAEFHEFTLSVLKKGIATKKHSGGSRDRQRPTSPDQSDPVMRFVPPTKAEYLARLCDYDTWRNENVSY